MQPGADVSQREQYGRMLCCPAGVKHVPLATLLGKVVIGDMRATVKERLNPHLSSVLDSLRRGLAQPTISAYCHRLLMSERQGCVQ